MELERITYFWHHGQENFYRKIANGCLMWIGKDNRIEKKEREEIRDRN